MAFSAKENAEIARSFVQSAQNLTSAVVKIARVIRTDGGGAQRTGYGATLDAIRQVWSLMGEWFARLSDSPTTDELKNGYVNSRQDRIVDARSCFDAALPVFQSAIATCAATPSIAMVAPTIQIAFDQFKVFDWSQPFNNPRHNKVPFSPFDESKTVVGPHGDLDFAKHSIAAFQARFTDLWSIANQIYLTAQQVPNDTGHDTANDAMYFTQKNFANCIWPTARMWAMHVDAMTDLDRMLLLSDQAKSGNLRAMDFFRTLLQLELIHNTNNNYSTPKNFADRAGEIGVLRSFRMTAITTFINRVSLVCKDKQLLLSWFEPENGLAWRFYKEFIEMWVRLDRWTQAAFGFYFPLPAPPASSKRFAVSDVFIPGTGGG